MLSIWVGGWGLKNGEAVSLNGGRGIPNKKIFFLFKWGGQLVVGRLNKEGGSSQRVCSHRRKWGWGGGGWVLGGGYTFMQGRFCCNIHSIDHAKQNHTNTGFIKRKGRGEGRGVKKRKKEKHLKHKLNFKRKNPSLTVNSTKPKRKKKGGGGGGGD